MSDDPYDYVDDEELADWIHGLRVNAATLPDSDPRKEVMIRWLDLGKEGTELLKDIADIDPDMAQQLHDEWVAYINNVRNRRLS